MNCFRTLLLVLLSTLVFAAESSVEPLPEAISDNAVAILKVKGQFALFSLMGIGPKKTWNSVTNAAYELDAGSGHAYTIHAVPGTAGRIAAMAIGAAGRVYLFGGYVVYEGGGMAVPDSNAYEPTKDRWVRNADIPTPVGDAVICVYRDRYIYLLAGRANGGPISAVQIYDLEKDKWLNGTPIPAPVFGHAGGLIGDTIIYVDGAKKNDTPSGPRFVASDECWKGTIDRHDPKKIQWTKLPAHPGKAHFRIAAGTSEKDEMIYFSGGSDNPHDYNGVGYDGKPSEPSPVTFAYNMRTGKWETLNDNTPNPTMDNRGLMVTPEGLVIIGGMQKGQEVTANIEVLSKEPKKK